MLTQIYTVNLDLFLLPSDDKDFFGHLMDHIVCYLRYLASYHWLLQR
jgi:hypothetical protein